MAYFYLIRVWFLALLGIAVVLFFAQIAPLTGQEGADTGRFLGRFHPLLLHFPVAFLCLTVLLEIARLLPATRHLARFVGPALVLTALSACATVVLGILLGANEGHAGALVERHRERGIYVAIVSCIAAALYFTASHLNANRSMSRRRNSRRRSSKVLWSAYGVSLSAAFVLMGLTAHDGGSLVHGPSYLADYAPKALVPLLEGHAPAVAINASGNPSDALPAGDSAHMTPISDQLHQRYRREVGAFLNGYCSRCHGDGLQEANVRFDEFDSMLRGEASQHDWQRVLGVLGAHRMPPVEAKQPNDQQRATAIAWIQEALQEQALARRAARANAPLRRLTKRELNHTMQDLFNVSSDFVGRLPSDPRSEHGYDSDASLLLVSMSDLRLYHDIARQAVQRYVRFGERSDTREQYFVELEDVYHYGRLEGNTLSYQRAAKPLTNAELSSIKNARKNKAVVYRDRKYGPLPHGFIPTGDVPGVGEGRGFARLHEQFMLLKTSQDKGEVRVRVSAAMSPGRDGDASLPRLRLEAGWRKKQSLRVSNVGEYDIVGRQDSPQTVEFKFRLEDVIAPESARLDETGKDKWLLLVLSNAARHEGGTLAGSIYGQMDTELPSAKDAAIPFVEQAQWAADYTVAGLKKWAEAGVPYLYLDALEAEIIPIESDKKLAWSVPVPNTSDDLEAELAIVEGVLREFASIAFRRSVSEAELAKLTQLFSSLRADGDSYETAVRETLAGVLISPHFLYIGYPLPDQTPSNRLADYEQLNKNHYLASRLSYFLWSSMPDTQLKELAAKGQLIDPYVLATQVDRMLSDPRSKRLTQSFADQWLQLDKLSNVGVSYERYPDYGVEFSALTAQQSIATFQDNFHNHRDARALYSSKAMMLNDQLARHYGVPDVIGGDIRRVELDQDIDRAGLLTQASILTINSDGTESHPIKRGVWILERVLNDPPPPPPPSVPDLDPNNPLLAGLTLKQKIEQHRELSACSGCHEKIDPWGILFEGFDATGRSRTHVKVEGVDEPLAIDASSTLPNGEQLNSVSELSSYLLEQREDDLMASLVDHLMIYALGRELDILDMQEAKTIHSIFRSSGYRLSELTKAIVQSDAFSNRGTLGKTHNKKQDKPQSRIVAKETH